MQYYIVSDIDEWESFLLITNVTQDVDRWIDNYSSLIFFSTNYVVYYQYSCKIQKKSVDIRRLVQSPDYEGW